MPYICLATANIPEGVLQITDLWPNVSQHNNPTYPAGQNRYLRRPGTDQPAINETTGLVVGIPEESNLATFEGLAAYLVDRVEPGALDQAEADITLAILPVAADRLLIEGVVFVEFSAGANNATTAGTTGDPLIVQIAGTAALTADNVTTVLADAGAIITMSALLGVADYPGCTNVGALITLEALTGAAVALLGNVGDWALTLSVAGSEARITLPEPARLARATESWDATSITAAVGGIQGIVDAGTALTLTLINTSLGTTASADLTGVAATSSSAATLAELLSVMAGRKYEVPTASSKFTAVTSPDTIHIWDATQVGSFTSSNTVFDSQMYSGEWGPSTSTSGLTIDGEAVPDAWLKKSTEVIGGDAETPEIGEARATLDTTAFQASLHSGQLAQFAGGVTLFPDQDVQARVAPSLRSMQTRISTLTGIRVVTVYDDDGSLLV